MYVWVVYGDLTIRCIPYVVKCDSLFSYIPRCVIIGSLRKRCLWNLSLTANADIFVGTYISMFLWRIIYSFGLFWLFIWQTYTIFFSVHFSLCKNRKSNQICMVFICYRGKCHDIGIWRKSSYNAQTILS